MRPADSLFSKKLTERKIGSVITNWSHARIPVVKAVLAAHESPRSFVHAPSIIGVPAHRSPILMNEPADLVNWLVFRGFANGQMARFVLCELCKKFGLRKRAKKQARFCSSHCQIEFNIKRRKDADFVTGFRLAGATILRISKSDRPRLLRTLFSPYGNFAARPFRTNAP